MPFEAETESKQVVILDIKYPIYLKVPSFSIYLMTPL